jgi:pimeloyl-ACP methyl ester carboxylesterase
MLLRSLKKGCGKALSALLVGGILSGCVSDDITIRKVAASERFDYSSTMLQSYDRLMPASVNILSNFLLNDLYRNHPERLLERLEKLYLSEKQDIYIETLADCSLSLGRRFSSDADTAARYYLSAVLYSYNYLIRLDKLESAYSPARLGMIRIYNLALTELFSYLCSKKIERNGGFELSAAAGQVVFFQKPEFRLGVDAGKIRELKLCADYRPVNLTHVSHRFGIGVPLIANLERCQDDSGELFADNMVLPATLVMDFGQMPDNKFSGQRYSCRFIFADSRNSDAVSLHGREIPLEQDLSTPLAFMAKDPPPFHFLIYMMRPAQTRKMQGLYRFESFDPSRIPVVLVHGLMSDTRTWLQMINTLRNDPVILKKYQIYGFSYSSGNPVPNSAFFLRQALQQERERIIKAGYSAEKFDQMILIGHSMGGLLSRCAISGSGDVLEKLFTGNGRISLEDFLEELDGEQKKKVRKIIRFEPLPFVKRVIFIAVPHRGSRLATSWIGRFGAWCIQLPEDVVKRRKTIRFKKMMQSLGISKADATTGIDNLDPDNIGLKLINQLPLDTKVPFHSIIGNNKEGGTPGGTDGIVPYSSSHLDGAQSELIVRSGHSAQKNPLAIQEVRRILLLHLEADKKNKK